MGEISAVNAIKSVLKHTPSFCIRGIKISEHLGQQLNKLGIDYGKDEAEMDVISVSCDGDKINVIFGESKVLYTFLVDTCLLCADHVIFEGLSIGNFG